MKKKALLLAIIFLSIQCSNKLITTQKIKGISTEKLNMKVIENHFKAKYTERQNLKKNNKGNVIETIEITDHDGPLIINTWATKLNGVYLSLNRRVSSNDTQKFYLFYPNGNLKFRDKTLLQHTVDLKINSQVDISPLKTGISEYFDEDGSVLQSINYDSVYNYSLKDVLLFIEKQPYDKHKHYGLSMLYLENIYNADFNQDVIKNLIKEELPLSFITHTGSLIPFAVIKMKQFILMG
jgi:hypothetical protein